MITRAGHTALQGKVTDTKRAFQASAVITLFDFFSESVPGDADQISHRLVATYHRQASILRTTNNIKYVIGI